MSEPTKFGRYEIKRELGRGAMGIIYEGMDPFIQRTVAIKTIQKSLIDESEAENIFIRFRREAQAAGRLTHPNIVSIYEYGEDNDIAFIAMELVIGKELKQYFDTEVRFEIHACAGIMQQLLGALEYSHSRSVVHRDIKPSNILITGDGQVKVADFGIAKIESSDLTQVGDVLGTPAYMSPEQFIGVEVDHRSDIYSAGVILYQFLTGERPFTGSMTTIMHKVLNQAPVRPSTLNPSVSAILNDVVGKAMAKRPEDRFQTAAEFMQALRQAAIAPHASAGNKPLDQDATIKSPAMASTPDAATIYISRTKDGGSRPDDLEFWKRIKTSSNPDDFRKFIGERPGSEFIELARQQRARLEESIARTGAEEMHQLAAELKHKQKAEEQANRAQRFAALKAAADAKLKEEMAAQARRAQKLSTVTAKNEVMQSGIKAGTSVAEKNGAMQSEMKAGTKPARNGIIKSILNFFR